MARTITLSNMIDEIRWAADVEGATRRHTDKKIVRAIDQAQQMFRQLVSKSGHSYFLSEAPGTFASGDNAITSEMPVDLVHVYTLDVQVGNEWRDMIPYELAERNDFQTQFGNGRGVPTRFHERNVSRIDIIPTADGSYPWKMQYLPTGSNFLEGCTFTGTDALSTGGSQTFDGIAGWEDWVIYEACQRISARDAGVNDNYEILKDRKAEVEAQLVVNAQRRVKGPIRRLDTRGRRLATERLNRWKVFSS